MKHNVSSIPLSFDLPGGMIPHQFSLPKRYINTISAVDRG